jgi:hypothetical protein
VALGRGGGDAEAGGGIGEGEAGEEAELDEFGLEGLFLGVGLEGLIEGDEVFGESQCGVERQAMAVTPMLGSALAARLVHQDASHGLGRGGEEMGAALPGGTAVRADEPEVSLVDECGGLKGLTGFLLRKVARGEFAEFLIDQGEELFCSAGISLIDLAKQAGHIGHRAFPNREQPNRIK